MVRDDEAVPSAWTDLRLRAARSALHPGSVHVWMLRPDAPLPLPWREDCLSEAERCWAASLRHAEARATYVRAHVSLRHVLSRYLDIAPARLAFHTGPWGKPYLLGGRSGVHFNLSHSGPWIGLAVARDRQIGLDFECVGRDVPIEATPMLFTMREQRALSGCNVWRRAAVFYRIWVRKEAIGKLFGEGLGDVRLRETDLDAGLSGCAGVPRRLCIRSPSLACDVYDLPTPSGIAAALAVDPRASLVRLGLLAHQYV